MGDMDEGFERALLALDRVAARNILMPISENKGAMEAVESLVVPVLKKLGEGWEGGGLSLAQIYMSGRICEELIDGLLPPADPLRKHQPKMAIAVLEDHHAIGKNIIYSTLRASGFEVFDFGVGVSVETLLRRTREDEIEMLLVSVLMLRSALKIGELISGLRDSGLNTQVVVGGAPFRFDSLLWKEVGADAMGENGADALRIVEAFIWEGAA